MTKKASASLGSVEAGGDGGSRDGSGGIMG